MNNRQIHNLNTHPFGKSLVEKLAEKLKETEQFGKIANDFNYNHRDYCGHGLIYDHKKGFSLVEMWDGGIIETIKTWKNQKSFIAFFEKQSDFSCSGYEGCHPLFKTADDIYTNKKRITAQRILKFVS
jgi:hypothetical protein